MACRELWGSTAGLDPMGHRACCREHLAPAFTELIRQAAQGSVLHNDDTTVKILELMGERARQHALSDAEADRPMIRQPRRIAAAFSPRAWSHCAMTTG